MKVTVTTFGIARELMGGKRIEIELDKNHVGHLRHALLTRYPGLADLRSILIAVNQNYAEDEQLLTEADEVALIPPVSGG